MTSFWCGKALKQKNKKIGLQALSRVGESEGKRMGSGTGYYPHPYPHLYTRLHTHPHPPSTKPPNQFFYFFCFKAFPHQNEVINDV